MKKLKIIFKLLPIVGNLIFAIKGTKKKDFDFWSRTISELIEDVIEALAASGQMNFSDKEQARMAFKHLKNG